MNLNKNGIEKEVEPRREGSYKGEANRTIGRERERGRAREEGGRGRVKKTCIPGVVERVGGYGALHFYSYEKSGYSDIRVSTTGLCN